MPDFTELKQRHRAIWASGDYDRIAAGIQAVADHENLPFAVGTFDVVVSSCGLMFAPDQPKVASEVARVTKPGGRIAIQA
jgi:ubiquinone/menaquinone biosynthesis C-methylase UbiE